MSIRGRFPTTDDRALEDLENRIEHLADKGTPEAQQLIHDLRVEFMIRSQEARLSALEQWRDGSTGRDSATVGGIRFPMWLVKMTAFAMVALIAILATVLGVDKAWLKIIFSGSGE